MKEITIGSLIERERKIKVIRRKKLSDGICSENTLYNIETDKHEASFFLLEILLQRLGRSPDKLEIILTNEEYDLIDCKEKLMEAIYRKEWEKADYLLKSIPQKTKTDKMYYARTKSFFIYYKENNIEQSKELILEAIQITLPSFKMEEIDQYLISTYEMENLLFLEQLKMEECKNSGADYSTDYLEVLMKYINKQFVDREEHAKIYGKCCYLLSKQYQVQEDYIKIIQICEKAINELRDYTIFYFMLPLLEQMNLAQKQLGIVDQNNKWYTYETVLLTLWDDFTEAWYPVDSIFYNCYQKEFSLDSECIQSARIAKKISQEELIEGIYQSPETLSRIENKKASPNKFHFNQLMDKLQTGRRKYYTYIVTESFEVMEVKQKLNILIMQEKYPEAMKLMDELKRMIDLSDTDNQMNIEFFDQLILYEMGMISLEELIKKEREIVLTRFRADQSEFLHIPTRNEIIIVNNLCINMAKSGQKHEAMELYLHVLNQMETSKIDLKFRYRSYALIRINYNWEKKSIQSAFKLMQYSFLCGKGYGIPYALNLIANEKESVDLMECIRWAKNTYVVCDLFHMDRLKEAYQVFLIKNNAFSSLH